MRYQIILFLAALLASSLLVFGPDLLGVLGSGGFGGDLDFGRAMDQGLLMAIGFAFLGGVLTSLTPCVYPLIPVTVAVFGVVEGRGRLRSMALSTLYVLGMAVMYASLGLAAALSGRLLGSLMTNVWVMGGIALLFVLFSASLLGAFEFRLPIGVQTRLSTIGEGGYLGAFSMGLVAGVIAAPCTGPVLGGVLAYVATSQDMILGALLLFVFAIGMGLLFWAIGTFSINIPKAGAWMDWVKNIFAAVMLVAALWFLKDAITPLRSVLVASEWVPWVSGGVFFAGILFGGIHRRFGSGSFNNAMKAVGLTLIVGGAFIRLGAVTVASEADLQAIDWLADESEAIALAHAEGKPLMIDFRADWCASCIELERHTFPDHSVSREAARFVSLKIDATRDWEPEIQSLLSKYQVNGLPTVVFINSDGVERRALRVESFVPARAMLQRMKSVD